MIPYEGCRVTGPYWMPDHRQRIYIYQPDGTLLQRYYHRYLMEVKLGRYLYKDEQVHHIDGNHANNCIDNLTILSPLQHSNHHNKKEPESFICPWCNKEFILEGDKLANYKSNKKQSSLGYKGPFCCGKEEITASKY